MKQHNKDDGGTSEETQRGTFNERTGLDLNNAIEDAVPIIKDLGDWLSIQLDQKYPNNVSMSVIKTDIKKQIIESNQALGNGLVTDPAKTRKKRAKKEKVDIKVKVKN